MAFSLFLRFFEGLNNSECDRPSLNSFSFLGENFLPLVCIVFHVVIVWLGNYGSEPAIIVCLLPKLYT